jgi:hypothetical protein
MKKVFKINDFEDFFHFVIPLGFEPRTTTLKV